MLESTGLCTRVPCAEMTPRDDLIPALGITAVYPCSATQTTAALHCEEPSVTINGAARGMLAVLLLILHSEELTQGMW